MCDMDSGSDFDVDVDCDVGSDVGSDYESDVGSASDFGELESVDDTNFESVDEVSNISYDFESVSDSDIALEGLDSFDDTDFESFDDVSDVDSDIDSDAESFFDELDSMEDASYETVDVESEIDYAESAEDAEALDSLESLSDGEDLELLESGPETDLSSLDNIAPIDTSEDNIEFLDIEQEAVSNSLETIESLDDVELITGEQVETENENSEATIDITDLEDTAIDESIASATSVVSLEDVEALIDNTDDIEQLYELRDSLVNGDVAENTLSEDFESLEETENVSEEGETTKVDWDQLTLNELSDETPYSEPDVVVTENEVQELIENETDTDRLEALRDSLLSGEIAVETDETTDDDSPKVLTREITPEIIESRERDTEETLENYRDNLREYGVSEEQIGEFVEQEREKINAEYESLDRGDTSSNIYYQPTDWEEVAASLSFGQGEPISEEVSNELEIEQVAEQSSELQELNINYDEIYEDIQQEVLEESFADIHIDTDPERLDNSLESFNESTWENLTLDEQKGSMETLADYVVDVIGFENPPKIEYYNNEQEGDFGGYDSSTNTLRINEYMLYNSDEAADTIAHELWHAHQYECAINPQNARDYQYQYNFENYIPPELGQEAYEAQLVEAEARAFAAQFKDRLSMIKGRSI